MPTSVSRTRTLPNPPDLVWTALAAFGRISDWARNVDHSCLLTATTTGPGAARRVQAKRNVLVETVTEWDPPARLRYRIDGLPRRLGTICNDWRVVPSDGGTTLTLTSTVATGGRPPQRLLEAVVARRLAKESDQMLDGLAAHLAADVSATHTTPGAPR